MRLRESFCAFIASPICHARTSLMATASNSSSFPCALRKSSSVVSLSAERTFFRVIMPFSRAKLAAALAREREIVAGRLTGLLDEGMKHQNPAPLNTEQHACDAVAGKVAANFPETAAHRPAERHANRPSVLNPHEVLPMAFRSPSPRPCSQSRTASAPAGVR